MCFVVLCRSYIIENRYCIDEFVLRLCRPGVLGSIGSFWFGLIDEVRSNWRFSPNRMSVCKFSKGNLLSLCCSDASVEFISLAENQA